MWLYIARGLVAAAREGRLRIVGEGRNEVTLCFVENAALAHVLAADTLAPSAPHAGRAFFIGQEEPVVLWDWINGLLAELKISSVEHRISLRAALLAGRISEVLWRALPLTGEPPMTRFVATQLATSHS